MVLLILMGGVYNIPCCMVKREDDDKYIEIQNTYVPIIILYILIYWWRYHKEDLYIYI